MKRIDEHQLTAYDFSRDVLLKFRHSTSTKRYARLMRALGDVYFPPGPRLYRVGGPPPVINRAARREHERKLTGAVRRGLERGKSA